MPWVRLDDSFHSNRKIRRAWNGHPRAVGLYSLALTYCAGQANDGAIDREWVAQWVPNARQLQSVCNSLVVAGLWHPDPDGWRVHDYLDYNLSAQEVRAKRKADAERQADYRARRHGVTPDGLTHESSRPIPTQPIKKEISKERKADPPLRRMGGPTHDEANAAGLSWAKRKAELQPYWDEWRATGKRPDDLPKPKP